MIKRSFINSLPIQLKSIILDSDSNIDNNIENNNNNNNNNNSQSSTPSLSLSPNLDSIPNDQLEFNNNNNNNNDDNNLHPFDESILEKNSQLDISTQNFLIDKLINQKGIIFTEFNDIQLKLFDVDSTLSSLEFDKLLSSLNNQSRILLCEKIKLIYGFDSLTSFIIRLINILNFNTFFSIFDITSNIKLYGFYSLNYMNPVEILVKQIRNDLFIVKSFKEFTIQEMKKEHDFHLPYKEFKRLNLNDGNLVVVKILFKNEQKPIDLSLIKPLLPKIKMLHLSLENESKLKPFNDLIDNYGISLNYLKFGVNRGTFKKIPIKNNIKTLKLVNIDNLNFINDLKDCNSLDVFFDNWELRKNCDIKFNNNFIIDFQIKSSIQNLKILNIFHTYIDSKDLNKLKLFPNLTHSKISYVILDNKGFDMTDCINLQELKIHFTYQKSFDDLADISDNENEMNNSLTNIFWPKNLKKLSITIHNIKNLIQNFSIRLNILKKIAKPLPSSIVDLCIDISYDTGGSGPELYSISRDDILKISNLINKILTNNLENLKLKGISRYNYKIGKPLIFSAINFPSSLKLLSLNDFILDYNFINLPNLKKLYFEHSLFDSDFKLPDSDEILIEKCTFKDLSYIPSNSNKIEFKMCTFRNIPTYNGDISNIIINNCRVMEQPANDIFQFQQQLQRNGNNNSNNNNNNNNSNNNNNNSNTNNKQRRNNNNQPKNKLNQQNSQQQHNKKLNDQINDPNLYMNYNTQSQSQSQTHHSNSLPFNTLSHSNSINEINSNSNYNNNNKSQSFDYNTLPHSNSLDRSASDLVNFLNINKDLEYQLNNLSINNSSQYLKHLNSSGQHTPNIVGISSPSLNLSISSPPISVHDNHTNNNNNNPLFNQLNNLYDSKSPPLLQQSLSSPNNQHFFNNINGTDHHHHHHHQQQQPLSSDITGISISDHDNLKKTNTNNSNINSLNEDSFINHMLLSHNNPNIPQSIPPSSSQSATSTRPSSQYLVNPILGAMNSGGNNSSISMNNYNDLNMNMNLNNMNNMNNLNMNLNNLNMNNMNNINHMNAFNNFNNSFNSFNNFNNTNMNTSINMMNMNMNLNNSMNTSMNNSMNTTMTNPMMFPTNTSTPTSANNIQDGSVSSSRNSFIDVENNFHN